MGLIAIENNGPLVTATNYFASEHARLGLIYVSVNAGAFRLLIPSNTTPIESAGAEYVIVTRGKWPAKGWRECLEFVWEDNTDSPFFQIVETQMADRLPLADDDGRTDLRCIGYAPDLSILFDLPARYRITPRVPYLKPWAKI